MNAKTKNYFMEVTKMKYQASHIIKWTDGTENKIYPWNLSEAMQREEVIQIVNIQTGEIVKG